MESCHLKRNCGELTESALFLPHRRARVFFACHTEAIAAVSVKRRVAVFGDPKSKPATASALLFA